MERGIRGESLHWFRFQSNGGWQSKGASGQWLWRFSFLLRKKRIFRNEYQMNRMLKKLAGIIIVGLAAVVSTPATEPAGRMEERRFEVRFMANMSDHHAGGIMMGEMCERKALRQELKDLCRMMAQTQAAEIAQMKSWLTNWYGVDYVAQVRPESMKEMEDLEKLSGAAFEVMFMKMLSMHHADAIMMSAECLQMSYHKELDQLCIKMIQDQLNEVKKLKQWLCEWHQICDGQNRMDEGPMQMNAQSINARPFSFSFLANSELAYQVDAKTSLTENAWLPVARVEGVSGVQTIEDSAPAATKFFRLRTAE